MAGKRKYDDFEPRDAVHETRQIQVYGNNPKSAKKPRQLEPKAYKKQARASSVNDIKRRIRDVTRRLKRVEGLPADVRMEDERALAAYHQELDAAVAEKTRQKMIKKYHMVRFFERQKATRQLKKLQKRLLAAESVEEVETLKAQMHIAEVDLNYTQYFPLSESYISLYPQQKGAMADSEDEPRIADSQPKPPMWTEVERCMEDGSLSELRNRAGQAPVQKPRSLRDRPSKSRLPPSKSKAQPPALHTSGLNRKERRKQQRLIEVSKKGKSKSMGFEKNATFGASESAKRSGFTDDGDSDGGFFEA